MFSLSSRSSFPKLAPQPFRNCRKPLETNCHASIGSKKTPPSSSRSLHLSWTRSANSGLSRHPFSKKKRGLRLLSSYPEVNTRGAWSDPIIVSANREHVGKMPSQSPETKTLSRTHRTGFSCLLVQVNLDPPRRRRQARRRDHPNQPCHRRRTRAPADPARRPVPAPQLAAVRQELAPGV
jgi:hypothetical protein